MTRVLSVGIPAFLICGHDFLPSFWLNHFTAWKMVQANLIDEGMRKKDEDGIRGMHQ
jgi:hypothetical protein